MATSNGDSKPSEPTEETTMDRSEPEVEAPSDPAPAAASAEPENAFYQVGIR